MVRWDRRGRSGGESRAQRVERKEAVGPGGRQHGAASGEVVLLLVIVRDGCASMKKTPRFSPIPDSSALDAERSREGFRNLKGTFGDGCEEIESRQEEKRPPFTV